MQQTNSVSAKTIVFLTVQCGKITYFSAIVAAGTCRYSFNPTYGSNDKFH